MKNNNKNKKNSSDRRQEAGFTSGSPMKKGAFKRKPTRLRDGESSGKSNLGKRPLIEVSTKKTQKLSYDELPTEIRINKYIAESGFCSRRKADDLIKQGVVKVNKKTITEMGYKVQPDDLVTINGDPVSYFKHNIYILLNKPKDVITTTSDEMGRRTVLDIVRKHERVYPVGRLDRNTTGALLITNDGDLTNRLMHPRYEVERTYNVKLDKPVKDKDAMSIAKGVELEDGRTQPCEVLLYPTDEYKATITLKEGKNHEVKRLFAKFGYDVRALDRKYFAGLSTSGLKRHQYRHLTKKEVLELKKLVGLI